MDRREFLLETLLAGAGLMAGGQLLAQEKGRMQYRYLGPSKAVVSVIGGNETFGPEVMREALGMGINYWHKANAMRHWPDVFAGSGLKRRSQIVEFCMDKASPAELVARFKQSLRRLKQDAVEVYKMHISWADEHVEAFAQLRQEGLVRTLAISAHGYGDPKLLSAIRAKAIDHVQVRVTPLPSKGRDELLRLCESQRIGVMPMKVKLGGPQKWTKHLQRTDVQERLRPYLPTPQAISVALVKYALAQPAVACVQCALPSVQRLREDAQAGMAAMTEGEAIGLSIIRQALTGRVCDACYACQKACPRGIPTADIQRYEMYATAYGQAREARRLYRQLPPWRRADVCDDCGLCEQVCRLGLPVRERIRSAHRLLA